MEEPRWWRLGNPLSWRIADRCLAIAVLMIISTSVVLVSTLTGGWPFLPFPAEQAPLLPLADAVAIGWWLVLALAAYWSRRCDGPGRGLAFTTTVLFTVTLAGFTLSTGSFASLGWIAYMGGAVVGYVLFSRRLAIGGVIAYAVLVIGCSSYLASGATDDLDRLLPPSVYAGLDSAAIVRQSIASLALFGLTFSVIAFVVDRWRAREAGYLRLASTDALTGLTNRRRFLEISTRELARARRYGSSMSLVLVDLDHFKDVNDRHGHQVGDRVLSHAALVLAGGLRDVDVIARHGGEEFSILLAETAEASALEVAERCCRRLADTPFTLLDGSVLHVTASMGVASCSGPDACTLDELLRRADAALYRAKDQGRDRVVLSSAGAA